MEEEKNLSNNNVISEQTGVKGHQDQKTTENAPSLENPIVDKELDGETDTASVKKKSNPQKIIIWVIVILIVLLLMGVIFVIGKRSADQGDSQEPSTAAENTIPSTTTPATGSNPETSEPAAGIGTTSPTETSKPDLYIEKYSFSEDPEKGEEFTVSIKIGNKGKANAGKFYWEWYASSNNKSCDGKLDSLAVGETTTVTCKYTYASWSTYETKAVIDSKSEIVESDENNNTATKQVVPIHDEAKADLYISEYKFNHPPKQGEEFTVSISIYNQGDAASEDFWWEWWPVSASKACREKIDGIAAHGGRVVTCAYTYASWANYTTKAVADADDDVSETNEGNNIHTENVIPIH